MSLIKYPLKIIQHIELIELIERYSDNCRILSGTQSTPTKQLLKTVVSNFCCSVCPHSHIRYAQELPYFYLQVVCIMFISLYGGDGHEEEENLLSSPSSNRMFSMCMPLSCTDQWSLFTLENLPAVHVSEVASL